MFDLTEPSHSGRSAGAVLAVGGQQRLRLDRVAQRGAGAVRLDRVHVGRRQPGVGQRLPDHPLLGRAVRRGQAVADAPSWLTAEPRTTASTRWPLRRASDSRSSSSMPTPSAQPVPSAPAANALHRPSGGEPALPGELDEDAGRGHHGHAAGQRQRALARRAAPGPARCSATSDDEQAVSTVTAGPSRPSV